MANKKIPYLCGGTLFFLLVQAKKPRAKAREREKGVADGLKDPAMMGGLIRAITGNDTYVYEESLKKNTSQFRECKIDGSTYIPFNDPATANSYDYEIVNEYDTVLSRICVFADDFLDQTKAAWLVRVLLDVIEQDSGIKQDAYFCIQRDGSYVSKAKVLSNTHFEFQPFLVGIIHYILKNRSDNISGQETLEVWGTKASERSERKLNPNFSLGAHRKIEVEWYIPTEVETPVEETKTDRLQEDETDYGKTEIIDDCSEEAQSKAANQTVFINSGSGIQIGVNYGTINLPSHRQKE